MNVVKYGNELKSIIYLPDIVTPYTFESRIPGNVLMISSTSEVETFSPFHL